jgi:hypothetical protein
MRVGGLVLGSPSASSNTYLQVGYAGIGSDHVAYNYDSYFANNLYKSANSAWSRISTRAGGLLRIEDDTFTYSTADSGTAGASATLSERLRITSAGLVGIGTSSPDSYKDEAEQLVVAKAGNCGITVASANNGVGALYFADGTSGSDASRGGLYYSHIDNSMQLLADGSARVHITSAGNVGIGTTSPGAALQITETSAGSDPIHLLLSNSSASAGTTSSIYFAPNLVGSLRAAAIKGVNEDGGNSTALTFFTNPEGNTPTERMRIDSSGRLLVGTSTSAGAERLQVSSTTFLGVEYCCSSSVASTSSAYHHRFSNGNGVVGSIETSGTSTSFVTSSDYRLKENVTAVTDGITRLQQLKPSRFNFVADPTKTVDGFIAHEAQAVVPECVTGAKDEVDADGNPVYQGIDQSKLVPLLTAALQEAIGRIETLEAEVAALKAQ